MLTKSPKTLEHVDKLVAEGRPRLGQFARVDDINLLDAAVATPSGKLLSRAQKQRKTNQFCFIGINHSNYMVGLAIVNLKMVSNGFIYVYDKASGKLHEASRLSPLAAGTHMPSTPNTGNMRFGFSRAGLGSIHIDFGAERIVLNARMGGIKLAATLTPSTQPMCLNTRTGLSEFVYMQKQNALSCEGRLSIKGSKNIPLTKDDAFANIDWTLGYMRPETFWNWSSIGTLVDDTRLGLNLVCGVNETSFTENACWLDDCLYNLPPTVFDYDQHNLMQPWRIYSNNQLPTTRHVELTFTPKAVRSDHTDAGLLASHFDQLIGVYDGIVTLGKRRLELKEVWGLAEAHYAKW